MFKAIIKAKDYRDGKLHAQVEFTDGVDSFIENFVGDDINFFNNWVKLRISGAQKAKDFVPTLTEGEYTVPEEPVVSPTQAELDKKAYDEARSLLVQAKEDLDLGLITKAEFDALVTEVKVKKDKV